MLAKWNIKEEAATGLEPLELERWPDAAASKNPILIERMTSKVEYASKS